MKASRAVTHILSNAADDDFNFEFYKSTPYTTIPISTFRKIETEIKKNIWYTPTAEGKELSYIYYWWAQEPK